jgi:hypothetical protein
MGADSNDIDFAVIVQNGARLPDVPAYRTPTDERSWHAVSAYTAPAAK